jgi:alkylhydroperoxidase/carboxymuconolactone decarboxylase family protein YurZ
MDYDGVIGVPITFIGQYCPEQFEIIGIDRYVEDNPKYGHRFNLNGKAISEPDSLEKALDLMGDILFVASSQQYGGFTLPELDKVLKVYAEKTYARLRQQTEEVKRSQEELNQTVKSSKSIFQDFTDTFMKMAKFNTINLIYDQIVESMSKAVEITEEYNEVLTEFTKVSDLSGESLQNYTEKLGVLGLDVARTTSEMIDGATQWKKSGFTDEESAQLAKIGAEFQNIADEELSASDAANILISAMQGFDLGTQQAEHIVDVINEVELFVTSLNRVNCGEKPMMFVSYNVI